MVPLMMLSALPLSWAVAEASWPTTAVFSAHAGPSSVPCGCCDGSSSARTRSSPLSVDASVGLRLGPGRAVAQRRAPPRHGSVVVPTSARPPVTPRPPTGANSRASSGRSRLGFVLDIPGGSSVRENREPRFDLASRRWMGSSSWRVRPCAGVGFRARRPFPQGSEDGHPQAVPEDPRRSGAPLRHESQGTLPKDERPSHGSPVRSWRTS
jgi:hypothetical protein